VRPLLPSLRCSRSIVDQNYVFPAHLGDEAFVGSPRVVNRVLKKAQIDGVSFHPLRHTYASIAAKLGFSELTIAGLLGHSTRGVTQRYIHMDEALATTASKTSAHINQLLQAGTSHEN
jgi:integrase